MNLMGSKLLQFLTLIWPSTDCKYSIFHRHVKQRNGRPVALPLDIQRRQKKLMSILYIAIWLPSGRHFCQLSITRLSPRESLTRRQRMIIQLIFHSFNNRNRQRSLKADIISILFTDITTILRLKLLFRRI